MTNIDAELAKDAEAVHKFKSSLYYRALNLLPPPSSLYKLFPEPNALDRLFPRPGALSQIFDGGLREKIGVMELVPHYNRAVEEGDTTTVKEIEDTFNHATGLESALTAAVSSAMTVFDPVGAAYTYFTGKNTLGGFNLTNQNLAGEKLFMPKSSYTAIGKTVGYVAGALGWIAAPLSMTIASGVALGIDGLLLPLSEKNNLRGEPK